MEVVVTRLRSTYGMLKDFCESSVWQDLEGEVDAWLEDIRDQLETVSDEVVRGKLQGNAEACRNFKQLPLQLMEALTLDIVEGDDNELGG